MARFSFECCPVMASSLRRSPCFTLTGSDVIDAVYYLSAAAKLATLLFGPALLRRLFLPRAAGPPVDYVVPLSRDLRKTIYVRKVKVADGKRAATAAASRGCSDHQQRRSDTSKQFAHFRQLVKNTPSEQIVDVSNYTVIRVHSLKEMSILEGPCSPPTTAQPPGIFLEK